MLTGEKSIPIVSGWGREITGYNYNLKIVMRLFN
jgi:hypothetical protein